MKEFLQKLSEELTGFNKLCCDLGIKTGKYEEIIISFGQQALTDAPDEMKLLLSPEILEELIERYKSLTNGNN